MSTHTRRALASATLMAGFLAVLYALDHLGLNPSLLRIPLPHASAAVYAIAALAGFGCALAAPGWRRVILLSATLVAAPIALGGWAAAWFGFAAFVIVVARTKLPVFAKCAAACAVWLTVPFARASWLDSELQHATLLLAVVWAGQLYAAFYLLVEREREAARDLIVQRFTVLDDAFYLLALPRLVTPFFQPISPRLLARAEHPEAPPVAVVYAAGLAAYAAFVAVIAWGLDELAGSVALGPLALPVRFCEVYARATYTIFAAIALFRLLGFHLPSGFRAPFLSSSFAEFFRRYNYYVRDAVLSLFYYPLLGRLRHALSPRTATLVSAFVGIGVGSFVLHDVLVPIATTVEPAQTIAYFLDPVRLVGYIALWVLIIVPNAGIAPRRMRPRSRFYTVLAIFAFNAVYAALWYAQYAGGNG